MALTPSSCAAKDHPGRRVVSAGGDGQGGVAVGDGLDLALQRVQAYRVFDDKTVVTVSQLFPVADVEEFTVSPQRQQLQAAEERRRTTREKSTVLRLVGSGAISDGTPLTLRPTTEVTPDIRAAVEEWVNQDPRRVEGRIQKDRLDDHRDDQRASDRTSDAGPDHSPRW
jgi:hypothetical protein